jgi:hypothetical protein
LTLAAECWSGGVAEEAAVVLDEIGVRVAFLDVEHDPVVALRDPDEGVDRGDVHRYALSETVDAVDGHEHCPVSGRDPCRLITLLAATQC